MDTSLIAKTRFPTGLVILILVQLVCVTFFVGDVIDDHREQMASTQYSFHLGIETLAALSLAGAIIFEVRYLMGLLRRKSQLEQNLTLANTAVSEVINAHFEAWKLSAAETDVAMFLVKGLSISEIAQMRGCAEGTVKAHLNAIYRKSGTHSRGDLLSLVIDSMMANSVVENEAAPKRVLA